MFTVQTSGALAELKKRHSFIALLHYKLCRGRSDFFYLVFKTLPVILTGDTGQRNLFRVTCPLQFFVSEDGCYG